MRMTTIFKYINFFLSSMNKRGVAPLIATLLLISFAVSVGMVVMNFGRAQVELKAECPINIGLHLSMIGGEEQICYSEGKKELKFTVENGVNIKVTGLLVNIIGSEEAKTSELKDAQIDKAGTYIGKVSFDSSIFGQIKQVKLTPKVILYDVEEICVEKALVVENVKRC